MEAADEALYRPLVAFRRDATHTRIVGVASAILVKSLHTMSSVASTCFLARNLCSMLFPFPSILVKEGFRSQLQCSFLSVDTC